MGVAPGAQKATKVSQEKPNSPPDSLSIRIPTYFYTFLVANGSSEWLNLGQPWDTDGLQQARFRLGVAPGAQKATKVSQEKPNSHLIA